MTSELKKIWVALVVVAIIAIGGYNFPSVKKSFGTISSTDVTATRYTQLLVDNGIMVTANGIYIASGGLVWGSSGALTDTTVVVNGVTTTYSHSIMTAATTTPCSIASPAATTTLAFPATVNFTNSASYANDYQLGKATTAFATTTNLGKITIAANALGTLVATSTSLTDNIIAPNSFINLRVSTSTASATFAPTGTCTAVFQSVN